MELKNTEKQEHSVVALTIEITKAEFESIYGENKYVTARGATRDGSKYSWKFIGTDVFFFYDLET